MKLLLNEDQKTKLEREHQTTRDGRVRDRIKAVLLASEGWSTNTIAQALRLHETTILTHLKEYQQAEKLKPENGGSQSYLNDEQTEQLIAHLTDNTYHHNRDIVAYVKAQWNIEFTISGMHKWLHNHHFSYKKSKGVPHKFDAQMQQAFISEYKALKQSASIDEPILFIDAVHPTQATKVSYGWIKTGQDKVVKTTGSRTRLNIVGALNLNDIAGTVVRQYDRINSGTMIEFLQELRNNNSLAKTLHIILDGAGYHRSKEFSKKAGELGIELHFLPPYSPNLNPIERLWKVMNEYARNNKYFSSAKQFRETITHFFEVTVPQIADSLSTRLTDNFQVLQPASSS